MGRRISLTVISCLLAVGFAAGAAAETADAVLRGAIEKRSQDFVAAFNRGDMDAIAGMYTEQAMAFPPDAPVVTGRAALRRLWQSSREGGVDRVALRTESVEGSGELAVETGTGQLHVRAADGTLTKQHLKFVVVWRQEGDGVWRLHRDIWNSLPAPE